MNLSLKSRAFGLGTLVFALLAIPCVRVDAQSTGKSSLVIASVADAKSGAPLADAEVTLSDLNMSARTDWSGEARLPNVAPGQHKFEIKHAGYATMEVDLMVQGDSTGLADAAGRLSGSVRKARILLGATQESREAIAGWIRLAGWLRLLARW